MSDCASPTPRDRAASTKVCWVSCTGGNSSRPTRGTGQLLQLDKPDRLARRRIWFATSGAELLAYSHRVLRAGSDRVMDQVGLTHLSLSVSELGELLAAVRDLADRSSRALLLLSPAMVRDPDGQLLELPRRVARCPAAAPRQPPRMQSI